MEDATRAARWQSSLPTMAAYGVLSDIFDAVLLRAHTGVMILDADLRFVLVNDAMAALDGTPAEAHLGRHLTELAPAAAGFVPALEQLVERGESIFGLELRTPPGPRPANNRWFRVNVKRVPHPVTPGEWLLAGMFDDITVHREEVEQLQRLASISRELTAAESTDDIAVALRSATSMCDDARFVNIAVYDPERRSLRLCVTPGVDPALEETWVYRPLDGSNVTPLTEAFLHGESVYVVWPAYEGTDYRHLVEEAERLGILATAALPLLDASGGVIGVLGMGWDRPFDPPPELRARLEVLSEVASQALERAQRTDAGSELVHHLQEELLAAIDPAEGLDIAVGYQPASGALGFGGDWYDVVAVAPDVTAIIVGDVVGHGVAAAAQMAQAKGVVRALTLSSPSLGAVFAGATRSLQHLATSYVATIAIARIDRSTDELTWTTAGHLPPILAVPGRDPEVLWAPVQPPVGMVMDSLAIPSRPIEPGSLLVLYTDGLVEQRTARIDDRLERLVTVIADLPDSVSAEAARDSILSAMVGDGAEDDVAIVVTRLP